MGSHNSPMARYVAPSDESEYNIYKLSNEYRKIFLFMPFVIALQSYTEFSHVFSGIVVV